MLDVNMIIANNIQAELKKENKKQVDLAEGIGVSKQTMSKIMNGARAINAIELHKISEYLHVSMDSLMKMPEKPEVLILDEPITGLDPSAIQDFYHLVRTLNKEEKVTIIMVTHDVANVVNQANKILHLKQKVLFYGTPEEYRKTKAGQLFLGGDL